MRRIELQPRDGWEQRVEAQGLSFHSPDDETYWDESACYAFDSAQIDEIEQATYALDAMCLEAVQRVIDDNLFERFDITEPFATFVAQSWERDEFTLYGRFDLAYDGQNPPKLLEYNADTPTSLLEAAVIQWQWMQDRFPDADQFNSIHERLIEGWRVAGAGLPSPLYFTCLRGNVEDYMTVSYLRDTAMQAGLETQFLAIEDIGWHERRQAFVDAAEHSIRAAFKLYPWEWMIREAFGPQLPRGATRWLEAPWKMVLSNKAILVLLYEMFPDSPYLLPASFDAPSGLSSPSYVRKPTLSREGANILMVQGGRAEEETEGIYGGPYVYQSLRLLPNFGGRYPVVGSWMVNGYACGIGIREDDGPITTNASRFIPHVILPR